MKVICEICGGEFSAQRSRQHGNRCGNCAGWLRALKMGPGQEPDADYEKLGMVTAYLIKQGKLKEKDFIHGLILGMKKV